MDKLAVRKEINYNQLDRRAVKINIKILGRGKIELKSTMLTKYRTTESNYSSLLSKNVDILIY